MLIYWDLTDEIDFSIGNDFFIFVFRSAVSAYVSSKIPRIISRVIDEIPKNSRAQILNFGTIELFFHHFNNDVFELYVKMKNIQDSKYSCGLINHRLYKDFVMNSYFIDEKYFNEMYVNYRNVSN